MEVASDGADDFENFGTAENNQRQKIVVLIYQVKKALQCLTNITLKIGHLIRSMDQAREGIARKQQKPDKIGNTQNFLEIKMKKGASNRDETMEADWTKNTVDLMLLRFDEPQLRAPYPTNFH